MRKNFILEQVKTAIRFPRKQGIVILDDGRNLSPAEAKASFKAIARATLRCEGSHRACGAIFP